jgi:hypothetical protein
MYKILIQSKHIKHDVILVPNTVIVEYHSGFQNVFTKFYWQVRKNNVKVFWMKTEYVFKRTNKRSNKQTN